MAIHSIGSTNGSSTQFYLTDALGSVLESFSDIANTASVLGNQAFGPYGSTQYQSGTIGTAKGFTGQYQDPSGLDYDTARYYGSSGGTVHLGGYGAEQPAGHEPLRLRGW